MNDEELNRIDAFITRIRAFRVAAAIGAATGWDANAVAIEPWHEKYHQLHVPRFFRDYSLDRDALTAAMEGHVVDETTLRHTMRHLLQCQFRRWLHSEDICASDLDPMVA